MNKPLGTASAYGLVVRVYKGFAHLLYSNRYGKICLHVEQGLLRDNWSRVFPPGLEEISRNLAAQVERIRREP